MTHRINPALRCLASVASVGVLAQPAFAQSSASASSESRSPVAAAADSVPSVPAVKKPAALEEVVVTATKRETSLQDTPMSVSAVPERMILDQGVSNFSDMVRSFPGLNTTEDQPGQRRVTIRGVQGSGENTVGLYYGEVPVTGPTAATSDPSLMSPDLNLFDVARVEVLRGPQGTLYGAGSLSGTMRIVFNEPDAGGYEGAVETSLTSVKGGGMGYTARGMANIPVIEDILAVRGVLYRQQRAGYVDNVARGTEDINEGLAIGGRIIVGFTPTSDISITATAHVQDEEIDDNNGWFPAVGEYESDMEVRTPFKSDFALYNVVMDWDLGFADLTASAANYRWRALRTYDQSRNHLSFIPAGRFCASYFNISGSCTPTQRAAFEAYAWSRMPVVGYQPMGLDTDTYEIRLTSPGGDRLDWTLGAFYESRADFADSAVLFADPKAGDPYTPWDYASSREIAVDSTQSAIFGSVDFHITDRWTLTLGARHYSYEKDTLTFSDPARQDYAFTSRSTAPIASSVEEAGWVRKVNLSYRATPDILFYGEVSEGFRPGGGNVSSLLLPPELVPFESDSLVNYELGTRTSWFDGSMTLNAALYRIDWTDMQIRANIPGVAFVTNAGAAQINGFEIEAAAHPIDGLQLRVTMNVMNAELSEDQTTGTITAPGLDGDRIPYEPNLSGSFSAQYKWPVFGELNAMARADYSYTGVSYTALRPTDAFYEEQGGFANTNLRLGIEGDNWGAYAFVENVFDVLGVTRTRSATNIERHTWSVPPRTVGVSFNRRF